ncbi:MULTISPECIES: hypothetical protein [Bradyrhizobium]|jgi:hypothetical protein|uniref:Uncharacterized protein n=1 Tax=Bradyrhizobium elkanii TaxID=29448 RepID=A0A8I1YCX0_BRAEL|nr:MULTISPECIES: hypothetical protein [Bradyrhizobium]MBP1297102.1 hypothetical protein [Bradyrhizobium elkanii]MCP1932136.1 hypothetical protein [Bradyrhizobium elkanii]MCS3577322.1 hypothetical protein [Bradyrhizobium elkanii]MCS3720198.1 hypothetical protein [Bradyrhizobium elkanii]MCS3881148.1 hypothetical protein [Bradyrhizobium elkanii]
MTSLATALSELRPGAQWVLRGDTIGDLEWLDTEQVVPTQAEVDAYLASPVVPQLVTPRQIRLALYQFGLRQQVEDYVNSQDITVQDSWNYATQIERTNPLILACKSALGKTDEELDQLFILAASIV